MYLYDCYYVMFDMSTITLNIDSCYKDKNWWWLFVLAYVIVLKFKFMSEVNSTSCRLDLCLIIHHQSIFVDS